MLFDWQYECTPLFWAADGGHLSVVQLLLSAHADINQADRVSESKVSKLYHSVPEVLCILLFNHGDGVNDDDC